MKILQVAYYYPPMGGAGVQRALKFSKYLPDFGVQPVVLAAHDPDYVVDASLAAEIPTGLEVRRVEHRPMLQRLIARRGRLHGPVQSSRASQTSGVVAPAVATATRRGRDTLLGAYAALQFPDDKVQWSRRAEQQARRLLAEGGIDLVFTSSPPVSAHRLGARLAREFGVPWVADFRDLWTDNPGYAAPSWRRLLDRHCESAWLAQARGVVTVTPSWRDMLAERLGPTCPVAFIPNGYDEADFAGLPEVSRRSGEFILVHTGTFYGPRDPAGLLKGVAQYLARARPEVPRLRLRLIGNMGSRFAATLAQFELAHPGVVDLIPYLPHRQALAELMAADALLLVVGGGDSQAAVGWLPGKIFEYLRAATPILLLGHAEGDAAKLLRGYACGAVADESDPVAIASAIETLVAQRPISVGAVVGEGVERFERRELTRQLAEFFVQCQDARRERA